MIARVAHADDKVGKKSKIIGMYVPTRFKDTQNPNKNSFEVVLEHRDAPIGFYID